VAGLGGEPYRDGSFEYYVSEKVTPNDPKGVGPFILAALEMEWAGVNGELTE
jgi:unsaturated rhamnogalacturonyl hydrolase